MLGVPKLKHRKALLRSIAAAQVAAATASGGDDGGGLGQSGVLRATSRSATLQCTARGGGGPFLRSRLAAATRRRLEKRAKHDDDTSDDGSRAEFAHWFELVSAVRATLGAPLDSESTHDSDFLEDNWDLTTERLHLGCCIQGGASRVFNDLKKCK